MNEMDAQDKLDNGVDGKRTGDRSGRLATAARAPESSSMSESEAPALARLYEDNILLVATDELKLRVWDLSSSPRALYAMTGELYSGPPLQVMDVRTI